MITNLGHFKTVVLDPGHGGYDKGAISGYGYEKDFALDVARNIKPLLEAKGLKVKMTRDSDIFVPLELRARIANATQGRSLRQHPFQRHRSRTRRRAGSKFSHLHRAARRLLRTTRLRFGL